MAFAKHNPLTSILASFCSALGRRIAQIRPSGAKHHFLEAQNSTKIEFRGLGNPSKKWLQSYSVSKDIFEPPFFRKLRIFQRFLDPKMEPKSSPRRHKIDIKKCLVFGLVFYRFLTKITPFLGLQIACILCMFCLACENVEFTKIFVLPR